MDYSLLTGVYARLEGISGRLEMTDVVAEFIKEVPDESLSTVLLFLRGTPFPSWSSLELGIADKLMVKALSSVSGLAESKLNDLVREKGDIGLVAEEALVSKPQTTLYSETLTVEKVQENLGRLAKLTGKGSQDKKIAYITELLSNASPQDSRYIVRLILGQLRIGVGDGIIRDAIAKAYELDPSVVDRAFNMRPDWGEVALTAKNRGESGLKDYGIIVGQPVKVMLAQKAESLESALEDMGEVELEVKYDGARLQIHKDKDRVSLFTRRLEDVTRQFPEVVKDSLNHVKAASAVIEGEVVAVDVGTRRPLPFQNLSRRIKRKYDIREMVDKIPVEVNLFDIIYHNGGDKSGLEFRERRQLLSESVDETDRFRLAENLVTTDLKPAENFYKKALDMGHEGVMVKNLKAPYQPGSRVGYMYKLKPVMESLDLVVTGGTWGEGRRASWIGSYLLSVYDPESGGFLEIGRMATGLTDEQLKGLTELFKPLITSQEGRSVVIKPKVVFEVAYEEIQKSPTYSSGYALRFPRLVRVREDKGVEEADTLNRVEMMLKK
ncbi:MAG: ATP-dependent DNA ligase [Candidatus Altiarchaeales archaeon]|nr:ATP-dependent DNA ligase [Candidatus Altiarchaeales archaeon]MBD3416603.1 ATP-dependent DNA ligase [Candidatus Altiarchaeales archaeon]